jgi:hypothetical protein
MGSILSLNMFSCCLTGCRVAVLGEVDQYIRNWSGISADAGTSTRFPVGVSADTVSVLAGFRLFLGPQCHLDTAEEI